MIRVFLGRIAAITFLGTLLAGNAQAEFPPPPHGENLITDPSFEAALEATPWQAESGALSAMLCPDSHCGSCYRRSGGGLLRFDARDTDDVWAIQQAVSLPEASQYELTLYLASCNGAATGSISVALGSYETTIQLDDLDTSQSGSYPYTYEDFVRHVFIINGAEVTQSEGEAEAPVMLTIANPSLQGADVAIDDLRLVAQDTNCAKSLKHIGNWESATRGGLVNTSWTFGADGSFSLITRYDESEGWAQYHYGTWCASGNDTLSMHVSSRCVSSDVVEAPFPDEACGWEPGEDCFIENCEYVNLEWNALFEVAGNPPYLRMRVHEGCLPQNLEGAPRYPELDIEATTTAIEDCPDPAVSGLEGIWGRGVCDKELDLPRHDWIFNDDGSFQEIVLAVGAGSVVRYSGTYTVDTETSPAQVDLHYTLRETYDDVVEEEGEPSDCGGGLDVYIDTCEILEFTDLGVFEIEGKTLKLATGDCRPDSTFGALEHELGGTFCVSEEALGEYSRGPGECGGEGEGEVCSSVPTSDASIVGTWHQKCVVPASKGGLLSGRSTEWTFNVDGTFTRESTDYNDEVINSVVTGSYLVDTSMTPHQVDLLFCEYCYDDVLDEEEGCEWCCSNPNSTWRGLYAVDGDFLQFRYGFNRPTVLGKEDTYKKDSPEFCPDDVEGEGEGDVCKGDKCEGEVDFGAYEAIQLFGVFDSNQDNQLNLDEAALLGVQAETFAQLDLNDDGQLSSAELLIGAGEEAPRHSADTDLDGVLSLGELLRAIQFYNAGGYSCAPLAESEDGYLPEPFAEKGVDPNCPTHAADYNPADGVISLSELLRAIQLYNTGAYTPCESGEDGFCGEG